MADETAFADYQDVSGVRLPARLSGKVDRFKDGGRAPTKQTVDGDTGDLVAPTTSNPRRPAKRRRSGGDIVVQEVAKGISVAHRHAHHSVLIEFADHLTLLESPNESRGLAVIAKIKQMRSDKPLTTLINTHHHFDHSAGIRAAVSEGLTTVVTHRSNVAFYEEAMTRPHTIIPDALSKAPAPPKVTWVAVDDELTLKDDAMTVVLYRIQNNTHADNNLMVYFPRERLLTQADIHMPRDPRTLGYAPWVSNLADNIKMHNLRVDRMMPLHGEIVPFSEFLQVVKDGYDKTVAKEPPPYRFVSSN